MRFRLSRRSSTAKSYRGSDTDRHSAGTVFASGYNNVPPRPPPPPQLVPPRSAKVTPTSVVYDNGTGRLDPQLIRDQGLPLSVKTTDQLAAFLRSHGQEEWSPVSSSHYSTYSPAPSRSQTLRYASLGMHTAPIDISQAYVHRPTTVANPMAAGIGRRYVAHPIVRILPGTTRKHKREGQWLGKGTLRRGHSMKGNSVMQTPKDAMSGAKDRYVETSGWYSD